MMVVFLLPIADDDAREGQRPERARDRLTRPSGTHTFSAMPNLAHLIWRSNAAHADRKIKEPASFHA
jgi:hypothetical protein